MGHLSSQLQPRIDAATATRGCAALQAFLTAAKTTSTAHEKATGFPNDALVAYIQTSQHQAGCPTKIGLPATAAVHTKLILTTLSLGSAADRQAALVGGNRTVGHYQVLTRPGRTVDA